MAFSPRCALGAIAVAAALLVAPQAAWAEGFVPDVPDAPMSIKAAELSALGDAAVAAPDGTIDLAMLVPMDLRVECDPASVSVGVDCGMPEMCGIDPCLCGSADSWGACSCNGYQECYPGIECTSSNTDAVVVEGDGTGVRLRSVGPGTSTVSVKASMPHHEEAVAQFVVNAGVMRGADFAAVGIGVAAVALVACIVVAAVLLARKARVRRAAKAPKGVVPPAGMALLLCLCACVGLGGCAGGGVGESSPHVSEVTFKPSSEMTEGSQKAEVRLTFDQPVDVGNGALDDLDVLVNGAPPDASTVAVDMRPDATGITVTLRPAAGGAGVGKGGFFALYQSDVQIASKRSDGAIPSICGADGSWAVLEQPVQGTFPSGLAVQELEVVPGSAAQGTPAQTTFKVTSPALIRAVTWFSPDGGSTVLLKHNHTFMDASAEDCAADLAKVVNGASGLGFSASAKGDTVVMRAAEVAEGQELHPIVVEGVGVQGGTFVPLPE